MNFQSEKYFLFLLLLTGIFIFAQRTGETELYNNLNKADAELNSTYKTALMKLSPKGRNHLRKSQRIWITETDTKCRNSSIEGAYENKLRLSCMIDETEKRTKLLKKWDNYN